MAQMYASNVFDERDMRVWEQKDPVIKTWAHLQKYFNDIYIARQPFSKACGGTSEGQERLPSNFFSKCDV